MRLQFLGANHQVTGSRYLLEAGGLKLLVDCGLFQERKYAERNWEKSPVPPGDIDFLLLTHSHVDHVGLVPRLVKEGFDQPIICTRASAEIARIVLLDSGRLQEEDAEFKKRRHQREGRRGKYPEVPLYTEADAQRALPYFRGVPYGEEVSLNEAVSVRFVEAGHILGSASLVVTARENGEARTVVFSGDLGQWDKALVRDPNPPTQADYVVMESTYGDSLHTDHGDPEDLLCQVINDAVERGGNIVIPTFAIERAQELMFHLQRLLVADRIPHLLIFVDSPMAVNVTDVFVDHLECLDAETHDMLRAHQNPFSFAGLKLVRTVAESKAINRIKGSCLIMAGSGMCTGGRIKHHLVR
ncbi:MAG: MBL fold metallo-hydrolase, partial [Gemmatimonadota bacterium]